MNKEQVKRFKVEIKAYLEGAAIDVRIKTPLGVWRPTISPTWALNCDYRVALPERDVFYLFWGDSYYPMVTQVKSRAEAALYHMKLTGVITQERTE